MPAPKVDEEAVYEEKRPSPATGNSSEDVTHDEHQPTRRASVAAKLRNPLIGMTDDEVLKDVDAFVDARGLSDKRDAFHKGALMARVQNRPQGYERISILSEEEKGWLRHEDQHRWSQPFMLYFLVVLCAGSAIVQGMDQTAVNGAQVRVSKDRYPTIRRTDFFHSCTTSENSTWKVLRTSCCRVSSTAHRTCVLRYSDAGAMHL